MATPIKMPQLGESVTEGTVGKWLKKVGEHVEKYEPLLEVISDKVDTEVTSTVSGVVLSIEVPEGETVPVGTVLAWIGEPGEKPGEDGSTPADAKAETTTEPLSHVSPPNTTLTSRKSRALGVVAVSQRRTCCATSKNARKPLRNLLSPHRRHNRQHHNRRHRHQRLPRLHQQRPRLHRACHCRLVKAVWWRTATSTKPPLPPKASG